MVKITQQDFLNLICAAAIIIVARNIVSSLIPIEFQMSITRDYSGLLGWIVLSLFTLACFLAAVVPAIVILRKQNFEHAISTTFIGVMIGVPTWIGSWFLLRDIGFRIHEISAYLSLLGGLIVATYLVRLIARKRITPDKQ